ncbi:hypothetical protein ACFQMM_06265 [Saliphagus sp. GCM10025308]
MADTLRFQCRNCGEVTLQNPRYCPQCGESVMRPVETSEPGSHQHELRTDEFDIEQALSRLDSLDRNHQKAATEQAATERADKTVDEENRTLLDRLKSLF